MKAGFGPVLAATLSLPAPAWSQVPLGDEFPINTYTTGSQRSAAVAAHADGRFVVAWRGTGHVLDSAAVFARRYDASGTPVDAEEFIANAYTTDDQARPQVATLPDGAFVVVWESGHDGHRFGVFGRRFDAAGVAGPEFQANTWTTADQILPAVAADAAGSFVVAWQSYAQIADNYGIYAQRYDASGSVVGPEFRVNANPYGRHAAPSVAMDAAGSFVVAWQGPDNGWYQIFARRYDSSGVPFGGDFQVNAGGTGDRGYPSVAADPGGGFAVAWNGALNAGADEGVFARRFDASGTPLGGDVRAHEYTTDRQSAASVASDAAGNFVVAWTSLEQDGSAGGVFARVFDRLGGAVGGEFPVNTYTTGAQGGPAVAVDAAGRFIVVWESTGQDGEGGGVFARRFVADPIFREDHETTGLDAWSASVTDGGNLAVSPAGAMAGSALGLAGVVDDTAPLYVEDQTPHDERRYRARLYFDPNGFDPGEAQDHRRIRIFIAFGEAPTRRGAALVLRRLGGAYSLMARVRREDGTRADTGFFPITDAPHVVELELLAATAPDAQDGAFELWIDGLSQVRLTGIDNPDGDVDFARMGALSVKTGAAGTLCWDEFESRRSTYIGSLP